MHTLASLIVLMVLFIGIWGCIALKKGMSPAVLIVGLAAILGAIVLAFRTGRMPERGQVIRIKGKRAR